VRTVDDLIIVKMRTLHMPVFKLVVSDFKVFASQGRLHIFHLISAGVGMEPPKTENFTDIVG